MFPAWIHANLSITHTHTRTRIHTTHTYTHTHTYVNVKKGYVKNYCAIIQFNVKQFLFTILSKNKLTCLPAFMYRGIYIIVLDHHKTVLQCHLNGTLLVYEY